MILVSSFAMVVPATSREEDDDDESPRVAVGIFTWWMGRVGDVSQDDVGPPAGEDLQLVDLHAVMHPKTCFRLLGRSGNLLVPT